MTDPAAPIFIITFELEAPRGTKPPFWKVEKEFQTFEEARDWTVEHRKEWHQKPRGSRWPDPQAFYVIRELDQTGNEPIHQWVAAWKDPINFAEETPGPITARQGSFKFPKGCVPEPWALAEYQTEPCRLIGFDFTGIGVKPGTCPCARLGEIHGEWKRGDVRPFDERIEDGWDYEPPLKPLSPFELPTHALHAQDRAAELIARRKAGMGNGKRD